MTNEPQHANTTQFTEQKIRRNQMKLIGIFAVALVPVVLASAMYFGGFGFPDQRTNKGDLIWPPLSIDELGRDARSAKEVIAKDPNWYLVLTHQDSCIEGCAEQLHMMRQVNVALGREMERVSRLMVAPADLGLKEAFADTYQNLEFAPASEQAIENLVGKASQSLQKDASGLGSTWNIWLVDPLGNIIVRYGPQHDGYDIKADLKKLLKLSNIG